MNGPSIRCDLHHAAQLAPEAQAALRQRLAVPAALGLLRQRVEPLGDISGGGLRVPCLLQELRIERAGNRDLLDDEARIAAVQALQDRADLARRLNDVTQIPAAAACAVASDEQRILEPLADEIVFERLLVLEVALLVPALHLVERRLGDEEMSGLDQRLHLPVEKGQQQRADMRAVDIGVGHDDDLVVAQLPEVELVLADARAERGDQRADLGARQHLVEARALDVQDLAAQGKHRLEGAVARLLGAAAG